MAWTLEAACGCRIGKVRKNNEDNFFFDGQCLEEENRGLEAPLTLSGSQRGKCCFAVLDGMGGENYGECASFAAADLLRRSERSLPERLVSDETYLTGLCLRLNQAVVDRAEELDTDRMGSTLVLLYLSRGTAWVCNLGDSRAYLLRDGALRQLSTDHTEERVGGRKAPLTQFLGIDPELYLLEPALCREELRPGDSYLLCSDGLTDMLSDEELARLLQEPGTAEETVEALLDAALDKGGRDNVTAILCRIL